MAGISYHRIFAAFAVAAAIWLVSPAMQAQAETSPLVLETRIPLADVAGRIDHLAVDLQQGRLFVAELGNNTVDVISLASGKVIHRIDGLKEPQGLGFIPQQNLLVIANGGDGSVWFVRTTDWSLAGKIELGDDADNVRIDAATGRVIVGYGDGALAVIDPLSLRQVGDIKLPGHPEGFRLDPAAQRAFVNIPDARRIVAADLRSFKVIATWKMADYAEHFPMALDHPGGELAIVFRQPAMLALLDSRTGAIREKMTTCGDADDVFFDDKRQQIYVSCGAGSVDIKQHGATGLRDRAMVPTVKGARTSLFVPELDRLFVAARAAENAGAAILVFRPLP
ncbi:YncE family protein [Dongia soli]|uniref:DNA-binding beta-propeller fold protein YncE n=1 Tax=Dongia soli TaxID=600628 RepID=A0ABU5EES4_9PROT|nr:hypothetical protein [Dongia soli]MDY0884711.1 hypothetical protein [Dongia soli]